MPADRRSPKRRDESYSDSPMAWFAEMLLSIDRGNFARAAESQSELERLGWSVRFRQPRNADARKAVPA